MSQIGQNGSNCDHIGSIFLHFEYYYFINQAVGPRLGPGPGSRFKWDQDRDQSSGPEMTRTKTNHRDQKLLGLVPVPRRSLVVDLSSTLSPCVCECEYMHVCVYV